MAIELKFCTVLSSIPGTMSRAAYCTLITSDSFLTGLQVMAFSLRSTGSKVPLVVLHTSSLNDHTLLKLRKIPGCILKCVPDIPNQNTDVHVEGWINSGCVLVSGPVSRCTCESTSSCLHIGTRSCMCGTWWSMKRSSTSTQTL